MPRLGQGKYNSILEHLAGPKSLKKKSKMIRTCQRDREAGLKKFPLAKFKIF